VNHYYFHIWDEDWGHVTIRMCGHPPFPAQILLNGHEYVACQARKNAGEPIEFIKEDHCFVHSSHPAGLQKVADTLLSSDATGLLKQICERWIYTTCLCFALDSAGFDTNTRRFKWSTAATCSSAAAGQWNSYSNP
jgi:hypothetical protein